MLDPPNLIALFKIFLIDLISFKNHLTEYHTLNGEGDNSLHTENGRSFTITKEFYKMIQNM